MATHLDQKKPTAHSLREAANSDNTDEGYEAMNDVRLDEDAASGKEQEPEDQQTSGAGALAEEDEHLQIARLAYWLYEERGRVDGYADQDWMRAEIEVRNRKSSALPTA